MIEEIPFFLGIVVGIVIGFVVWMAWNLPED